MSSQVILLSHITKKHTDVKQNLYCNTSRRHHKDITELRKCQKSYEKYKHFPAKTKVNIKIIKPSTICVLADETRNLYELITSKPTQGKDN